MNRFFVYKEYGAKYDMMLKEVGAAPETMPEWESYQKGLEALASTIGCDKNHIGTLKKSLTIGDLLMKVSRESLVTSPQILNATAYPKNLQIPSPVCRAAQIHHCIGLPKLAYGGG